MSTRFNKHLEEAINNIKSDRKLASELLEDVAEYIGENKERHKDVGQVAAKYLETLQRSNEQLVKLTGMIQKSQEDEYSELSETDKENMFDLFESGGEG